MCVHVLTYMYVSCFQRRGELENHSVDAASTSEAVGFITLMQELKRQVRSWEQKVEVRNSKHICMYMYVMHVHDFIYYMLHVQSILCSSQYGCKQLGCYCIERFCMKITKIVIFN